MHQLTLSFDTLPELQAAVVKLAGPESKPAKTPAPSPAPTQAPAPAPAAAAPTPPSVTAAPESAAPSNSDDPFATQADAAELSFENDVLPALKEFAGKVKREEFAALLIKFGADSKTPKVDSLKAKPEKFADIIKACKG